MQSLKTGILLFLLILPAAFTRQNSPSSGLSILSPGPGEALQGIVSIRGTTALANFVSAEVDFAYSRLKQPDWFIIQDSQEPVTDGTIATWDTTTITDGIYDLRLVVSLSDGSQQQVLVTGVRVRNYSTIETNTPAPTATMNATQSPVPPTATATLKPTRTATKYAGTLTPLPTNPAGLAGRDVLGTAAKGGLLVVGLFLLGGLYVGLKSLNRH